MGLSWENALGSSHWNWNHRAPPPDRMTQWLMSPLGLNICKWEVVSPGYVFRARKSPWGCMLEIWPICSWLAVKNHTLAPLGSLLLVAGSATKAAFASSATIGIYAFLPKSWVWPPLIFILLWAVLSFGLVFVLVCFLVFTNAAN